jgi:hypothetical protein
MEASEQGEIEEGSYSEDEEHSEEKEAVRMGARKV